MRACTCFQVFRSHCYSLRGKTAPFTWCGSSFDLYHQRCCCGGAMSVILRPFQIAHLDLSAVYTSNELFATSRSEGTVKLRGEWQVQGRIYHYIQHDGPVVHCFPCSREFADIMDPCFCTYLGLHSRSRRKSFSGTGSRLGGPDLCITSCSHHNVSNHPIAGRYFSFKLFCRM